MKIISLKLENFRGYEKPIEINFDNLTVFIGKNDIGKSTILEALDIFFNEGKAGTSKIEKTDVNVNQKKTDNLETIISICFDELPEKLIIDTDVETNLKKEYLLNSNGYLEIAKKYKNGGTAKIFAIAKHPSNPKCKELLLMKNSDLKRIVKQENIECENQSINTELRQSIWNHYRDDLQLEEQEIEISKEDAKKIWDKLNYYMPVYSLFRSDRENTDDDNEVQDPLKEAVKQILAERDLQEKLSEIANVVNETLKDVADRTLEKIKEMDSTIADTLNPVIPSSENLKWQDVFTKNVSIFGDENIPINKRGSGVKRLVLLNFFRAEAERKAQKSMQTGIIYAIEEPETSQHTANQNLLINAFKKLASSNQTQVILTTHSSNIVKQLDFSNLRLIKYNDNNQKVVVNVEERQLSYPSLNEVNYIAFGEVTEEYHDELYSYIEFQGWKSDYLKGKATRKYQRLNKDGSSTEENKTLTEYIRHQIHHPENLLNVKYSKQELNDSIDSMRKYVQSKRSMGLINEP